MKVPSLKPIKAIVIGVIISTLVGLAALVGIHYERNTLLREVRISGIEITTNDEFDKIREVVIGQHLDSLNLAELVLNAMALPYVDTAFIRLEAAGALVFDVVEYEAIGLLVDGNSEALVAEDGTVMPLREEAISESLPLIYGYSTTRKSLHGEPGFEEITQFLTASRAHELSWITISEVTWNKEDGVVALSHENGVKLLFGSEHFEESIQKWIAFYKEVILHKGIDAFHTIDLRFRGQIVTREATT